MNNQASHNVNGQAQIVSIYKGYPVMKKNEFGQVLRTSRLRAGLSQQELAEKIGTSRNTISAWEFGKFWPSERKEVLRIGEELHLTFEELDHLLILAQHPPVKAQKAEPKAWRDISRQKVATLGRRSHPVVQSEPVQELQVQVKDIESAIDNLANKFENQPSEESDEQSLTIAEEVQNVKQQLAQLQSTSREITAPVRLPSPQDMEVKLVAITSLERLEEYRADENEWRSWFGVFMGAIIAVFINIFTGSEVSNETYLLGAFLVLMCLLTGWSALKYRQRGNALRDDIFEKQ